ncbi:hypothetical protein [Prosthecochloris sp. ZM]|nr:hypothetical protein [Prosthecochloris sp. ZM]
MPGATGCAYVVTAFFCSMMPNKAVDALLFPVVLIVGVIRGM